MLKNKILTIVLAMMLISPVFAEVNAGDGPAPITESTVQEESVQQDLPKLDTIPYKQPVSKKKVAKKFLMAMGGVALSSILLFLLLTLYNRIRNGVIATKQELPTGETSLVTPENLIDAIKIFLEKTKY